jgi:opacity protein-like surface antigen
VSLSTARSSTASWAPSGENSITPRTLSTPAETPSHGVLIGVGVEYALTDNWTTKFEYNYIDYGNKIVNFTNVECDVGVGCFTSTNRQTIKEVKQIAKIGVNYKF